MGATCPKCQTDNPETARFCLDCGTQIGPANRVLPLTETLKVHAGGLAPKTVLGGRYEIVGKIGAGGMGEVYRARDRSLDREVAVKVLPEGFVGDLERVARFKREAKLLASLDHPNIATVHGFEEAMGKHFLVLELVEGETLAQRIARGPVPVDDALEICRQIAEGLEAAHDKAIVHRDLKPANVKITPGGKVKILDFGLAKAARGEGSTGDPAHSPTITGQMTQPGVVLGTAAYMSPEQAKGKSVDKRADIWAFGCVLYECLSGKKAFPGDTITETLAAVLKGEPDWAALPAETPFSVRAVIKRCLRKEALSRLRDIADVRMEMLEDPSGSGDMSPAARRFPLGAVMATGAATLVIGLLAGPAVMKLMKPAAAPISPHTVRSVVRLDQGSRLAESFDVGRPSRTAMVLSRDGRFIVYAAAAVDPGPGDIGGLYLQKLNELKPEPMPGTERGYSPFLSPDDRWVGFWAGGKLMKVAVEGGVPTALCDVAVPFGFTWGDDGWIVFSPSRGAGLCRVPAEGGRVELLTTPDGSKGEYSHRLPFSLPGAKGILFTIKRNAWDPEPRVAVLEPGAQKWKVLLEDAADARFVPTGHLVFLRKGTLMAARFDPEELEVTGQPVSAVAGVEQALATTNSYGDTGAGQFCASDSGALVYAAGGIVPDQENSLVLFDREGNAESATSIKAPFWSAQFSPDGRRIAYSSVGIKGVIRVLDLERGTDSRLTTEGYAQVGVWTPDGRRIVFDCVETGVPNLYWQPCDGSSPKERLTQSENMQLPGSWSPAGQTLAFNEVNTDAEAGYDIRLLHLTDRKTVPFLESRFIEVNPSISPNGNWLAYQSNESGRSEVYVRSFPGPGEKWQVSGDGGADPLWSRDGRELFYRRSRSDRGIEVFAVDVRTGPEFSSVKSRLLFAVQDSFQAGVARCWDISPDGKKFLMVKSEHRKPLPVIELVLVQNWLEELERLAPSGKR